MLTGNTELVSKNNAVIRMNKAKAYRELQKRQGRFIRRVWNDGSPIAQSYDSAYRQSNSRSAADSNYRQSTNMIDSERPQQANYIHSSMFSVNNQRPLARSRVSSRCRDPSNDPGRPITAPEANPYATLDGTSQEVVMIPFYPQKANSVRSNTSDTQSLNEFKGRRQTVGRKPRHSLDLTQSIDCNCNEPLKPRDQNEPVGEAIQYPAASKMREMLSTDSSTPMEKAPVVAAPETATRSIIKRSSQISFASRLSTQAQPSLHNEQRSYKSAVQNGSSHRAASVSSARKSQTTPSAGMLRRKSLPSKQVSFCEKDDSQREKITPKTVTVVDGEETQPLALTTKNLNMYNAMILKTLRTSKFDERVVQWVKERQCQPRTGIPQHDSIPEVDETSYSESHGRITPNKRSHAGGTTLRESERTIHVLSPTIFQNGDTFASQSAQLKQMKPTTLETPKSNVELSGEEGKNVGIDSSQPKDSMSTQTESNQKESL